MCDSTSSSGRPGDVVFTDGTFWRVMSPREADEASRGHFGREGEAGAENGRQPLALRERPEEVGVYGQTDSDSEPPSTSSSSASDSLPGRRAHLQPPAPTRTGIRGGHGRIWNWLARCAGRIRRRPIRAINASDVRNSRLAMTDVIDVIVSGEQELNEVALRPRVLPEELGQPDWAWARRVHMPARPGRSRAPPPDERPVTLHDALELGHAAAKSSADAAGEAEVAGRHVQHCEKNLGVMGRRLRTKPLGE